MSNRNILTSEFTEELRTLSRVYRGATAASLDRAADKIDALEKRLNMTTFCPHCRTHALQIEEQN